MFKSLALLALASAFVAPGYAQRPSPPQGPVYAGYLCCNMRTTGSKITDINYEDEGKTMLPVGTPVSISTYDFRWVELKVNGGFQRLMNDYSRDLKMPAFANRFVITEDPRVKLAGFSDKTRKAILAAKVVPGMTREQVVMSVGYPVTSENPDAKARVWRFWLDTWTEFQVEFDDSDLVKTVSGEPATLARVTM